MKCGRWRNTGLLLLGRRKRAGFTLAAHDCYLVCLFPVLLIWSLMALSGVTSLCMKQHLTCLFLSGFFIPVFSLLNLLA